MIIKIYSQATGIATGFIPDISLKKIFCTEINVSSQYKLDIKCRFFESLTNTGQRAFTEILIWIASDRRATER